MSRDARNVSMQKHILLIAAIALLLGAGCAAEETDCEVRIITEPDQAALFVDRKARDATPAVVTLAEGDHLVVVRKEGYEEARRTITVAKGQKKNVVQMRLKPVRGLVLIHSDPQGATVTINGKGLDSKTPLVLTGLRLGVYQVAFTKSGYLPVEKELVVASRAPVKLTADMRSDSGALVIESDPPGAEVMVNGVARGTTPCTVEGLTPGDNNVIVRLDGYETYNQPVRIRRGQKLELDVPLEPLPASLTVYSEPSGAVVYVDSRRRGTTPLTIEDIEPGEHSVRTEHPGYSPLRRTVYVREAGNTPEEFRMARNSGILQLTTRPAGVRVFVDGKFAGTTTNRAGSTGVISEPFVVDPLSEGNHTVQLSKKGYADKTVSVQIAIDQVESETVELDKLFIPDTIVRTGTGAENTHIGRLVHRYENGDVKLEVAPGIFQDFKGEDITAVEDYDPSDDKKSE
jgi:hypothetical protein